MLKCVSQSGNTDPEVADRNRVNADFNRNNADFNRDTADINHNIGDAMIEVGNFCIDDGDVVNEIGNFFNNRGNVVIEFGNFCNEVGDVVNDLGTCSLNLLHVLIRRRRCRPVFRERPCGNRRHPGSVLHCGKNIPAGCYTNSKHVYYLVDAGDYLYTLTN